MLTVTLTIGVMLIIASVVLLIVHPTPRNLGIYAGVINQQNQQAKTALYVATFVVVLPLALVCVPRLAGRIAGGPHGGALPARRLAAGQAQRRVLCPNGAG